MKPILIATDLSKNSERAIQVGLEWAKIFGLKPVIAHAYLSPEDISPKGYWAYYDLTTKFNEDDFASDMHKRIQETVDTVAPGTKAEIKLLKGVPSLAIAEEAEKIGAELLVVGLRGHNILEQIFVGSVAQRVFKKAKCAVLGVHEDSPLSPANALMATDFSECSEKAYHWTKRLQEEAKVDIDLFHAITPQAVLEEVKSKETPISLDEAMEKSHNFASSQLHKLESRLDGTRVKSHLDVSRLASPQEMVIDWVEKLEPDLVIMGTHGRKGVQKWLMGSVAEVVAARANTTILMAK